MTIINQPILFLTDEQVLMLAQAIRDGRVIVVSGETVEEPTAGPGIARALPANVRALPARKVG